MVAGGRRWLKREFHEVYLSSVVIGVNTGKQTAVGKMAVCRFVVDRW